MAAFDALSEQLDSYREMAYPSISSHVESLYGSNDPAKLFGTWHETDPEKIAAAHRYIEKSGRSDLSLESLTSGLRTITSVPWQQMNRFKPYDKPMVGKIVEGPSDTSSMRTFDPRMLHANQPSLVVAPFLHYFNREPGLARDKEQVGNLHPFVYIHRGTGVHRLLSGHHRAAAALLRGKPLHAKYAIGD